MRFLIVYQDFSKLANDVVALLGVEDITVLSVKKGERAASAELLAVLKEYPDAPTAICQVVRKFRKSIEPLVDIQYETKKFRSDDQRLKDWIQPTGTTKEAFLNPHRAMLDASTRAEHLVIAEHALDVADKIASHRWKFVNLSADLLARYAEGEDLGASRNWKQEYGVDFAANGGVRYNYHMVANGDHTSGSSEWHLKEGDNTSRESAARIYFDRIVVGGLVKICVFYVGPHPEGSSYSVLITCN